MEEFTTAEGYQLLDETLLLLENKQMPDPMMANFLSKISKFAYVGTERLSVPLTSSPYSSLKPSMIHSESSQPCVRNTKAVLALQTFFVNSKVDRNKALVLDNILRVYAGNLLNFALLQNLHTIAHFIEKFEDYSFEIKEGIMNILVFIVTVVNHVPFLELSSLSCLLQDELTGETMQLINQALNKIVSFDPTYKKILQEAGLLVVLFELLKKMEMAKDLLNVDEPVSDSSSNHPFFDVFMFEMVMSTIILLVDGSETNIKLLREHQCDRLLFTFIQKEQTRHLALNLLEILIAHEDTHSFSDVTSLISILQNPSNNSLQMKKDILCSCHKCFLTNQRAKDAFFASGGFICVVTILFSLEEYAKASSAQLSDDPADSSGSSATEELVMSIVKICFRTLTAAIANHKKNRKFFREQIIDAVKGALSVIGILPTIHSFTALDCLIDLSVENTDPDHADLESMKVYNPEALLVVIELLIETPAPVAVGILKHILQILSISKYNAVALSRVNALESIVISKYSDVLLEESHSLRQPLLNLIETIAPHYISAKATKAFLRLIQPEMPSSEMLKFILNISEIGTSVPYVEFNCVTQSAAFLYLRSIGERAWPPANGFSFSCWMYIDQWDLKSNIDLFSIMSDDKRSSTVCQISPEGKLILQTSQKSVAELAFKVELGRWIHIVLMHSRHRFQSAELELYCNGFSVSSSVKFPFASTSNTPVGVTIGCAGQLKHRHKSLIWRLGPCFLYEDVLSREIVLGTYFLGPSYTGSCMGSMTHLSTAAIINPENLLLIQRYGCSISDLGPLSLSSLELLEDKVVFRFVASAYESDPSISAHYLINVADSSGDSKAVVVGDHKVYMDEGLISGIRKIGGISSVLYLIENVETPDTLLDLISIIVALISNCPLMFEEMNRIKGYEIINNFLSQKKHLLTEQLFDKLCEMAGIVPSPTTGRVIIRNMEAFDTIILSFDTWKFCSLKLQSLYFERLLNLINNNNQSLLNVEQMRKVHILRRLFVILVDENLDESLIQIIVRVIRSFLAHKLTEEDIQMLVRFLASTLNRDSGSADGSTPVEMAKRRRIRSISINNKRNISSSQVGESSSGLPQSIRIRNSILDVVLHLLSTAENLSLAMKLLPANWIFMFIHSDLHQSTVLTAVRILVIFCQAPKINFVQFFNKNAKGFDVLACILPSFSNSPTLYYILFCLLFGKSVVELPENFKMTLNSLVELFPKAEKSPIMVVDAVKLIFAMLKKCCEGRKVDICLFYENTYLPGSEVPNPNPVMLCRWPITPLELNIQVTVIQFLSFLVKNNPNFQSVFWNDKEGTTTQSVVSVLFPHSRLNSPVCEDFLMTYPLSSNLTIETQKKPSPASSLSIENLAQDVSCHYSSFYMFEFLNMLLTSSVIHASRAISLLDALVESLPLHSQDEFILFYRKILFDLMITLPRSLKRKMLFDSRTTFSNVSKLCEMIVHKVCANLIPNFGRIVFRFIVELLNIIDEDEEDTDKILRIHQISPSKQKVKNELNLIYRSLNRVIIFLLAMESVPKESPRGGNQKSVRSADEGLAEAERGKVDGRNGDEEHNKKSFIDVLTVITREHSIIRGNFEHDFFYHLCHVLYKFLLDADKDLRQAAMATWSQLLKYKPEIMEEILTLKSSSIQKETISLYKGFHLLLCKEFDQFSFWMSDSVQLIHFVFEAHLAKPWVTLKEQEKRTQFEHKRRLALRRTHRLQRKDKYTSKVTEHVNSIQHWRQSTCKMYHEKQEARYRTIYQEEQDRQQRIGAHWKSLSKRLRYEKTVWGPEEIHPLTKWRLDRSEGPQRMRKKMRQNRRFYEFYPYVIPLESPGADTPPTSFDSKAFYEAEVLPKKVAGQQQRQQSFSNKQLSYPSSSSSSSSTFIFSSPKITATTVSSVKKKSTRSASVDSVSYSDSETDLLSSASSSSSSQLMVSDGSLQALDLFDSPFELEDRKPLLPFAEVIELRNSRISSSTSSLPDPNKRVVTDDFLSDLIDKADLSITPNESDDDESGATRKSLESPSPLSSSPSSTQSSSTSSFGFLGTPFSSSSSSSAASHTSSNKLRIFSDTEMDESEAEIRDSIGELGESRENEENIIGSQSLEEYEQEEEKHPARIQQLLEKGDSIETKYNCGYVSGMDNRDGIMLICSHNIYIICDYKFLGEELVEVTPPPSQWEQYHNLKSDLPQHKCYRWSYDDIKDIDRRLYLLRQVALEIFSNDGRNFLVVFDKETREEVYNLLSAKMSTRPAFSLGRLEAETLGIPINDVLSRIWRNKENFTMKWVEGKISNFHYLMYLNTLAGRSYNDLTQYPVFPWILADYESDTLNLNDPNSFRDLSKPMGALTEVRAEQFMERFNSWDPEENQNIPRFHHGSHYSSAGIVLFFMIRVEPYTQQFLNLQSGRFDIPDRLFHSLREAWQSASGLTCNLSDVKELIPEFFYLPEMFMNGNRFNLGKKESGELIDGVVLPPWAKGSAREFIRLHRQALESEYVSEHLHEWIDLIFGFKQQGKAAEEALNVFYYLTYEGAINIDAITNPVDRECVIAQINNFGQTPRQLFKKPHPKRIQTAIPAFTLLDMFCSPRLESSVVKEIKTAVGFVRLVNDRLLVTSCNRLLLPTSRSNKLVCWGFPDNSIRIRHIDSDKTLHYIEGVHEGKVSFVSPTEDGKTLVTGGTDSSIAVLSSILESSDKKKKYHLQTYLHGHTSPIVTIAVSRAFGMIVSSAEDKTCFVWDLNKKCLLRSLSPPDNSRLKSFPNPISMIVIHEKTGDILLSSGNYLFIYDINGIPLASQNTASVAAPITSFSLTTVSFLFLLHSG